MFKCDEKRSVVAKTFPFLSAPFEAMPKLPLREEMGVVELCFQGRSDGNAEELAQFLGEAEVNIAAGFLLLPEAGGKWNEHFGEKELGL